MAGSTYLATFRAVASKYPDRAPSDILRDLVASTPGEEGKWFAAAKSAGLYEEAIELANRTPCDPKTLTRAARDLTETEPRFALEAGLAALWSRDEPSARHSPVVYIHGRVLRKWTPGLCRPQARSE